jgi:branched-chain amino acid transport system ATP-binding protein
MAPVEAATQDRVVARDDAVLELRGLSKRYGGVKAVENVELVVTRGARVGIIGPNGAGKTTLFKLIAGDVRPTAGMVLFEGVDITRQAVHKRARAGLGRTFQVTNLMNTLTVGENLRLASTACRADRTIRTVEEVVDAFGLHDMLDRRVGELAYGQQRRLELALALCGGATTLLLDEPAAGLGPDDRRGMHATIDALPRDLTILLIEHDIDLTLGLVDRVICLHYGELVADDRASAIRDHEIVRRIYLGEDATDGGAPC